MNVIPSERPLRRERSERVIPSERSESRDGDDGCAYARNSTPRRADPASSGASGRFRGLPFNRQRIRPLPGHRRSKIRVPSLQECLCLT